MRVKPLTILGTSVAVLALLTSLFFLLPKTNCCDESDPQLEQLTDRAAAGQLDAIETLYERAKKEGVEPMQEHWAFEGALRGDKALRRAYVEIFKSEISVERRQRLLATIKASEMPGAPCLLESLEASPPISAACK